MAGLTKEQKKIIREIEKEAIDAGVDPDFAIALANLESTFQHIPAEDKKSTAFGPFQVNKATAEANGVDYEEMKKNPELAIKTGIKNIVRHMNNPTFEGDPARIAAAHRYGENSEYAKTGDRSTVDPTLRDYLLGVAGHYPNEEFPESITYKNPEKKEQAEQPAMDMGSVPLPTYDPTEDGQEDRRLAGAAGALAGSFIGGVKVPAIGIYKKAYDYLHRAPQVQDVGAIIDAANRLNEAKTAGQAGGQGAQQRVNVPMGTQDAGRMAAGQTGVMPYNYAKALGLTDIEAAQALDMTKGESGAHGINAKRAEGMQRVNQIAPNQFAENPLYGGLLTQTPSVGGGPRASYAMKAPEVENGQVVQTGGLQQLPKAQPVSFAAPPARQPSVMNRAATTTGKVLGKVAGSSPVMGGLAGYGLLYNAEDAFNKAKYGDIPGAITSGIGSVASGASVIPKAAPYAGSVAAIVDADRRRKEQDYIGAITSGLGAVAPYVAPFALGPEVGIPVGIATALGAPVANELKDYLQRGGDQTPAPKKAFRHRGFGLD